MTSINYGSLDFYGFLCLSVPSISCSLTSEEMVSHLIRCVFHFSVYKGEILHVVSSEWFLFLLQTSTLPSFPEMVSNHPFFIFFSSNISISHAYAFPAVASFLNVTIPLSVLHSRSAVKCLSSFCSLPSVTRTLFGHYEAGLNLPSFRFFH